jgi:hypothetical protein
MLEALAQDGEWYVVRVPGTAQVGHVEASSVYVIPPPQALGAQPASASTSVPPGTSAGDGISREGLSFALGRSIALGSMREGPVTFDTARFRVDRGQLVAEVHVTCAEGHDQDVALTLELFDNAGSRVTILQGSGGVEEEDDATIKIRGSAKGTERVSWFTLRATTHND